MGRAGRQCGTSPELVVRAHLAILGHRAPAPPADGTTAFIKVSKFGGAKPGYVFKRGEQGVGYYMDKLASKLAPVAPKLSSKRAKAEAKAKAEAAESAESEARSDSHDRPTTKRQRAAAKAEAAARCRFVVGRS